MTEKHKIEGSYEEVCKNTHARILVCKQLNRVGKEEGLMSFQQAKNIVIDPESFGEKKILTNTMKLQRFAAREIFAK